MTASNPELTTVEVEVTQRDIHMSGFTGDGHVCLGAVIQKKYLNDKFVIFYGRELFVIRERPSGRLVYSEKWPPGVIGWIRDFASSPVPAAFTIPLPTAALRGAGD